ncbi:MAG TPA: DUF4804 domain-containing protein [Parachlamydiaceae bacterium]|nr:DUF4804 domain-containing protein [Parachlamydiaceae bacterium]
MFNEFNSNKPSVSVSPSSIPSNKLLQKNTQTKSKFFSCHGILIHLFQQAESLFNHICQNAKSLYKRVFKIEKSDTIHPTAVKSSNVFLDSALTFEQLVDKSDQFDRHSPFPTHDNRIFALTNGCPIKQQEVLEHARNTRPIIHEKTMQLVSDFINLKKQHGTDIEKQQYQDMSEKSFIDRLLTKRPLMFMTESDSFLLADGKSGAAGFESIGTPQEQTPLVLANYLSYDEMAIAALLGVSVPTHFINNGNRYNLGEKDPTGAYEEKGVYTALVGARFEKPGLMEWQHMIITAHQNTEFNGYGEKLEKQNLSQQNPQQQLLAIWEKFYGHRFPTNEEATADQTGNYIPIGNGAYLNKAVYKERMRMSIETFLIDANQRGMEQGKKAYVHAVGLGLGVWQISPAQAKLMIEVYAETLSNCQLAHISDIDFSWFPDDCTDCGGIANLNVFTAEQNDIKIHFSKRNPADQLTSSDEGKLLVASYAWDGNSYPGNEYWAGALSASGDPAAACCSTIAELQNPHINPNVSSTKLLIIKIKG